MKPFLHIFNFSVPMYGLCVATGLVVACFILWFLMKKFNKQLDVFIGISSILIITGFMGAKLLFIIVSYPVSEYWFVLKNTVAGIFTRGRNDYLSGGFVFYGGLIAGIPFYFLAAKLFKVKYSTYLNEFAVAVPIVHGFGRIGCFCAGCCYGIRYNGIFSVSYPEEVLSDVQPGVPHFPVQLLETFMLFILAAVIIVLVLKNVRYAYIYYPMFYCIIRFALEFLRFDSKRGFIFGISTSQFISILLFIACASFLIIMKIKNNKSEKEEQPVEQTEV